MVDHSPSQPPAIGWRSALIEALWLVVLLRIALGLLAAYVVIDGEAPGPCHFELALNGWQTVPPLASDGLDFGLLGVWQRWDACWYGKIATFGFEPGTNGTVFFPLVPLLTGLLTPLTGGSVALAGYLLSAAASVVALASLIRLVGRDLGPATGRRTALYVSVFPSAFFLVAPFTEATFLACSALAILGARERRWAMAGVAGFLGGLARLQGLFLLLPLGWEAVRSLVAARQAGTPPGVRALGPLVAALAPIAGAGLYIGWTAVAIGVTPFEAQDAWGGREFHAPWDVAAASIRWGVERGEPLQFVNLGLLGLFGLVTVLMARRLPLAYTLFAAPQILLLAIRLQPTPLTATSRYLLVVFPVMAALALLGRRRLVDRTIVIASTLGLGLLAAEFVRGVFVG